MPIYLEDVTTVIPLWMSDNFYQNSVGVTLLGRLASERLIHLFYLESRHSNFARCSIADMCLFLQSDIVCQTNIDDPQLWHPFFHNLSIEQSRRSDMADLQYLCLLLLQRTPLRTDPCIQAKMAQIFLAHSAVTFHCYEHVPEVFRDFLKESKLISSLASSLVQKQNHLNFSGIGLAIGKFGIFSLLPGSSSMPPILLISVLDDITF